LPERFCSAPGACCGSTFTGEELPESGPSSCSQLFLEQCQQRVYRIRRIDVEHQPMAVLANRREHKYLRRHLGLQLHDKPHHAWLEAPGTKQLDVGIVASNLASESPQARHSVRRLQDRRQDARDS
jgi:hypothetical protein